MKKDKRERSKIMAQKKAMSGGAIPSKGRGSGRALGLHATTGDGSPIRRLNSYDLALSEMRKSKPDGGRALLLLQKAHAKGDPRATYALATWHLHGAHVPKNIATGTALLKIAASKSVPDALYDLAVSYMKGVGVRRNEKKGFDLFLRAAIWGEKQSYYEIGRCLFYGIGTSRNRRLANVWLDRAKSLGVS